MNIFERASKLKLRFTTARGSLTTEDLWTLSKPSIDRIMKTDKLEEREMLDSLKTPTDKQIIVVLIVSSP